MMNNSFQQVWDKRNGLLGSLAFHLLLIIIFLIFKINGEKKQHYEGVELDLMTLQELAFLEFQQNEDIVEQDDGAPSRNIAVNQQEDRIERFDDYDNYKLSGQSVNNIVTNLIEEDVNRIIKDNNLNPTDSELPDISVEPIDVYVPKELEEEQVYEGPTNIYFSLKDRKITRLIVPVYKCQGGGLIQVEIRVNRRGKVEWTSIDTAVSTTSDPCLVKAAKRAASQTKFNFSTKAAILQTGTITFRFIAQ
ncbi:MAG: hypothetical protein KAH17_03165 [Bacteroidales bacterium]|nr:hypothetical protein [Bacteroidales bacterium]